MNNILAVSTYIPLLSIVTYIFVSVLVKQGEMRRSFMSYLFLCASVMGWILLEILVWFVNDATLNAFLWNLSLVFVALAPLMFFLFVCKFYYPDQNISFLPLLFIVPVINLIIAVTPARYLLFVLEVNENGFDVGAWFWVHSAFCYVLTFAGTYVIVSGHIRKPKFYKLPSYLIIFAISAMIVSNASYLLGFRAINVNLTIVGTCIALILIHVAIIGNDKSVFIRYARGEVFKYLSDYVLVMGIDGTIADCNANAGRWLKTLEITINSLTLNEVVAVLKQKGASVTGELENPEGLDISIIQEGIQNILNLRVYNMTDKKENKIGTIAIFTDVTQNRQLLERLDKKAGIDFLTGFANRTAFEGAKARLDSDEHYPLSVILCDVNGLKEVNDTLGHKYGDMLINSIAKVLDDVTPKHHFVARIGGDEFIYLIPNSNQSAVNEFIMTIKEALAKQEGLPFKLSMAIGTATKQHPSEILDDIIAEADHEMYADKKRVKES